MTCFAIRLDVTDRKAFARAADETERALGNVHIVCNNAGINLFNDISEATYQDWDWVLGVNLGGVVNGVVTFVPGSRRTGKAGTSSTLRRWPRSSPGRGQASTRQPSSRCTACPMRCGGASCRTG